MDGHPRLLLAAKVAPLDVELRAGAEVKNGAIGRIVFADVAALDVDRSGSARRTGTDLKEMLAVLEATVEDVMAAAVVNWES